ncbi:MAG: hypothetical protein AAGD01_03580, partial [Acidobacteriota bacterium]
MNSAEDPALSATLDAEAPDGPATSAAAPEVPWLPAAHTTRPSRALKDWLVSNEPLILDAFAEAALNPQVMPRLAQLPGEELRRLVEIQWLELRAVLLKDSQLLQKTRARYRTLRQRIEPALQKASSREDVTRRRHRRKSESAAFREERLAVVRALVEADPDTYPFREELLARLLYAAEYQRVTERSLTHSTELLAGGSSGEQLRGVGEGALRHPLIFRRV